MYIVLCSYKALTGLSEKRLVSTKPTNVSLIVEEMEYLKCWFQSYRHGHLEKEEFNQFLLFEKFWIF